MSWLRMCVLALALPVVLPASTAYTVTVQVVEDGDDNLILTGNTLSWGHLDLFANGGVTCQDAGCSTAGPGGHNTETNYAGSSQVVTNPDILVTGTDSANAGLNFTNSSWYNGIQGNACSTDSGPLNCSATANGYVPPASFDFTLPFSLGTATSVALTVLNCGGTGSSTCASGSGGTDSVSITQQPGAGNGFTAITYLNDQPDGGTHVFEVELSWTSPAPEPASMALVGIGLAGLGIVGRRRRARR